MAIKFANNATTTLSSGITSSATSISVASSSAFPTLGVGDYTYITLDDKAGTIEIVKLTAISGSTFTVVRGQDGTSAASFAQGDQVELRLTAALLNDISGSENIEDVVAQLLQAGAGVDLTYDDVNNELTIDSTHIDYDATNNTGSSIPIGTPVYQTGSAGNTITIAPADANGVGTMPAIGITAETIADAGTGKVTFLGIVRHLDTSSFTEGDTLYISETAGSLTATRPIAPGSSVQNFARVVKSHVSNGSVVVMGAGRSNDTPNLDNQYVFIGNGTDAYEKRQLTTDDTTEGTNLFFTTARVDSHLSGGTGVDYTTGTISIGQAVATTDNVTFNDVIVSGDLTVSGTTTTVNTETINLADNLITLNSNETGTPSENAGIEVERGTSTNTVLRWNETSDKWELTEDGSSYYEVLNDNDIGTSVQAYDSNLTSFVSTFTLPTTDSTSGYVLQTNGSGTLSFVAQSAYDETSVSITGGNIDGTPVGATTPSTGDFTTLTATSLTVNGGAVATDDTALALAIALG